MKTMGSHFKYYNVMVGMGGVCCQHVASHHCGLGSIPKLGTCELSLLLILSLASRVVLQFSSLRKNQLVSCVLENIQM
jgi:hypothetical protein